ncbi:GNAT family N-acetyltransferase [Micromonospora sp. NPDC053740]|uniref:GNAT family N-acetyltransferase n=1 Tax=Micromonospora sp. NPDC053740 TaxID=3155173 RepID=UPI00341C2B7B
MEMPLSKPVTVRLAQGDEREHYISLFEECGLDVYYMRMESNDNKYVVYVAEDASGTIVGALEGTFDAGYPDDVPPGVEMPQAWLSNLGVLPDNRRQNVGRMLVHRFAQDATARGLTYVAGLPDQHTDDQGRLGFFERCGLTVITSDSDPGKAVGGYLQDVLRLTS